MRDRDRPRGLEEDVGEDVPLSIESWSEPEVLCAVTVGSEKKMDPISSRKPGSSSDG